MCYDLDAQLTNYVLIDDDLPHFQLIKNSLFSFCPQIASRYFSSKKVFKSYVLHKLLVANSYVLHKLQLAKKNFEFFSQLLFVKNIAISNQQFVELYRT